MAAGGCATRALAGADHRGAWTSVLLLPALEGLEGLLDVLAVLTSFLTSFFGASPGFFFRKIFLQLGCQPMKPGGQASSRTIFLQLGGLPNQPGGQGGFPRTMHFLPVQIPPFLMQAFLALSVSPGRRRPAWPLHT